MRHGLSAVMVIVYIIITIMGVVTFAEPLPESETDSMNITLVTEQNFDAAVSSIKGDFAEQKAECDYWMKREQGGKGEIKLPCYRKSIGTYNGKMQNVTDSTTRLCNMQTMSVYSAFELDAGKKIYFDCKPGYRYAVACFDNTLTIANTYEYYTTSKEFVFDKTMFVGVTLARTDNGTMQPEEWSNLSVMLDGAGVIPSRLDQMSEDIDMVKENPINNVELPFNGFKAECAIKKQGNTYFASYNKHFVEIQNGVVVFIKPDGDHNADGLTVLTPLKTISEAMSVANVQTVVFLDGIYTAGVNFFAGETINKPINFVASGNVTIDNGTGDPIKFKKSMYCDGIHFKGGNNTVIVEIGADDVSYFENCTFSDSTTLNGLAVLGGTSYVINCTAYGNAFDGLNYHANGSVVNHALEVGCVSYGNGHARLTYDDGQSSNATTSHDGSYIVRVNGDYKACHGGVVADKECLSANYGCKSGISTVTDQAYPDRMSNYWSSKATMYLYDCESYGSKYDTAVINGGTITSNIEYANKYVR